MAATGVDVGAPRTESAAPASVRRARRVRGPRVLLHAFLIVTVLVWLAPLVWTVYTSLRPYQDTFRLGYFSIGGHYGFGNFTNAWNQADLIRFYGNTLIVTVPAVVLTLLLASFVAFAVSRFSWKLNVAVLIVFTAGNLLPQQVIITPLYRLLHLRAQQLHADDPARAHRGGADRRGVGVAPVLAGHHAALPSGAGRAGDAGVHLHLQRLLLGPGADVHRRQAADHLGAGQPPGHLFHRRQPDRRRRAAGRPADADRVPDVAAAVRARPDAGGHQGIGIGGAFRGVRRDRRDPGRPARRPCLRARLAVVDADDQLRPGRAAAPPGRRGPPDHVLPAGAGPPGQRLPGRGAAGNRSRGRRPRPGAGRTRRQRRGGVDPRRAAGRPRGDRGRRPGRAGRLRRSRRGAGPPRAGRAGAGGLGGPLRGVGRRRHATAGPDRMVLLVPLLHPGHRGRHAREPRRHGRAAPADRGRAARRRLPGRDRRLAGPLREVPVAR